MSSSPGRVSSDDAQLRYARVLEWGTRLGIVALVITFGGYCTELLPPLVPLGDMPKLWGRPVAEYLQRSGLPTGWGWARFAGRGDIANLVGIGVLSGVSLLGMLAVIPIYLRRRDWPYAAFASCGSVILVLAASSLLDR